MSGAQRKMGCYFSLLNFIFDLLKEMRLSVSVFKQWSLLINTWQKKRKNEYFIGLFQQNCKGLH